MNRRVIGIAAAVVLALVGTVSLVAFVSGAEQRALEGEELVEVYVVNQAIPTGTPAEALTDLVTVEQVPVKVRPTGAVDNLTALDGTVVGIDLEPGEQLIASRFVAPSELAQRAAGVRIPDDMLEVTINLDPQRAIGGLLEPGQTVAVLASFEPFDLSAVGIDNGGNIVALPETIAKDLDIKTENSTDTILRKALVTVVQQTKGFATDDETGDRLETAPEDQLLVTLAVTPHDAERLVFSAEYGTLWLAVDRIPVPVEPDDLKTRGNVYTIPEDYGRIDTDSLAATLPDPAAPSTGEADAGDGDTTTDGTTTDGTTDGTTEDETAAGAGQ